jgi:hypothetical protein
VGAAVRNTTEAQGKLTCLSTRSVLVMRLFGKQELIENLKAAGFASIRVHEGPKFQIGVTGPVTILFR